MSTHNIPLFYRQKDIHILCPSVSQPGAMINTQWLEIPISETNFNSPKDVRVI